MHIAPHDNANKPIIDVNHPKVPATFFNIVKLNAGETFESKIPGYETCIAPATGSVDVFVGAERYENIGGRGVDVWDGEPEGVYVPTGMPAAITCKSESAEVFIAGARFDEVLTPFAVRADEIDHVQYGSDETKTHRKIKHILGQKQKDRVGRLLVSELFTVGAGGWSGFPPHKHDEDRLPIESKHDEVYNFRFRPNHGFGMQLLEPKHSDKQNHIGEAFHLVDGSTFAIEEGYHPCVAAPGYEMYYFTILGGHSQRPLVQFFHPLHEYQVHTIPGIADMVAKFK